MIDIENIKIEKYFSGNILEDNLVIPRCYEISYFNKENKIKINITDNEKKTLKDCITGRWYNENNKYILYLILNIDGEEKLYDKLKERNDYIRKGLPKIIKGIIEAEYKLFIKNNDLQEAEVFIKFNSMNDDFYKVENWGKINKYKDFISNNIKHREDTNLKDEIIIATLKHHIEIYLISKYGKGIIYFIRELNIGNIKKVNNLNNNTYEVIVLIKLTDRNIDNNINLKAIIDKSRVFIKEYKIK